MTNAEYRKSRGTDKPFATAPEQANTEWRRMNKKEIDAAAAREKARGGKLRRWQADLALWMNDFGDD